MKANVEVQVPHSTDREPGGLKWDIRTSFLQRASGVLIFPTLVNMVNKEGRWEMDRPRFNLGQTATWQCDLIPV